MKTKEQYKRAYSIVRMATNCKNDRMLIFDLISGYSYQSSREIKPDIFGAALVSFAVKKCDDEYGSLRWLPAHERCRINHANSD